MEEEEEDAAEEGEVVVVDGKEMTVEMKKPGVVVATGSMGHGPILTDHLPVSKEGR